MSTPIRCRQRPTLSIVAVFVLMLGSVAGFSRSATLRVPSEFPTIQSAIDAAIDGDLVIVATGTYAEAVDFLGKHIALISAKGPGSTTLTGPAEGSIVTFANGEGPGAVLDGFTLSGGTGTLVDGMLVGGAIYCSDSSPTLLGNRFEGNDSADEGAAVYVTNGAAPIFDANVFTGNHAAGYGGAIRMTGQATTATIRGCRFVDNTASISGGALSAVEVSHVEIVDCVFRNNGPSTPVVIDETPTARVASSRFFDNSSGALLLRFVDGIVEHCHFEGNVGGAGALAFYSRFNSKAAWMVSNVVVRNESDWAVSVNGEVNLVNNVIAWNTGYNGGVGDGAALVIWQRGLGISLHDTIAENRMAGQLGASSDGLFRLTNSIVWSRFAQQWWGRPPYFDNCLVKGDAPGAGNNIDADPRLADFEADVHLRIESPCVDAARPVEDMLPEFDIDGDPRSIAGRPGSEAIPDIGADEMRPELAARYGSVDAAQVPIVGGGSYDVVFVNGSAGNRSTREVLVDVGEPLRVDVTAPPSGPPSAPFAIYAWVGEPTLESIVEQPFGLGWTGMPTPLQGSSPGVVWNNLGRPARFGEPDLPSGAAPSVLLDRPRGLPSGSVVTLQGFILDDRAESSRGPLSVTNAVVIRARD